MSVSSGGGDWKENVGDEVGVEGDGVLKEDAGRAAGELTGVFTFLTGVLVAFCFVGMGEEASSFSKLSKSISRFLLDGEFKDTEIH